MAEKKGGGERGGGEGEGGRWRKRGRREEGFISVTWPMLQSGYSDSAQHEAVVNSLAVGDFSSRRYNESYLRLLFLVTHCLRTKERDLIWLCVPLVFGECP